MKGEYVVSARVYCDYTRTIVAESDDDAKQQMVHLLDTEMKKEDLEICDWDLIVIQDQPLPAQPCEKEI